MDDRFAESIYDVRNTWFESTCLREQHLVMCIAGKTLNEIIVLKSMTV